MQVRVHSGKAKQLNDATGAPMEGHFKYTLKNDRVQMNKVRLRSGDYGIGGKWYLAKRKPKSPAPAAAAAAAAAATAASESGSGY